MSATTSGAPEVTGAGRPTVEYRAIAHGAAGNRVLRVDNTKTSREYVNFTDTADPITSAGGIGLVARGNESIICWDDLSLTTK